MRYESADVGIGARVPSLGVVRCASVIGIVGGLQPGIEDYLLEGVVRVQRGDEPFGGVIEEDRADTYGDTKLECMCGGEKRLVLADGVAFVIEDGPTAGHPPQV